jgi:hypothetical protein
MVGNGILGNRDVFDAAGGAGCLGEIYRLSGPEHIVFALFDLIDIGFELFIVPNRNGGLEFFIGFHPLEVVFPAKNRFGACF